MIRRVLVAVLLALVLASCGVGTESNADIADDEAVPFGLLDADRQPVTGQDPDGAIVADIYLYNEDETALVEVARRVGSTSLEAVLVELQRAPTAAESADDLRSALADVDAIATTEVSGGVAAIDLTEEFGDISGSDQLVAIAQVVFTATARPGIGQVRFTLDGQPIEIPRGDGSLTDDAVSRRDFRELASSTS